jgi:hypothetical protein
MLARYASLKIFLVYSHANKFICSLVFSLEINQYYKKLLL